ncbi:Methyl-accepting chemotaxis sensory transducer with Cache sensor [Candidatus Accumulibacter aalborgensis]|uniref:Methyl-accepting chemotaxis sensory transducer with Cache sensor n=1 Tax=Candidatus Accumulibacter aalborgensis TaxID=1860102 RepID=A0A1A8XWE2_9PROT|nr:methyl-accepting chemotaxis protein [Candidatus Accumulibacter aalborgensis]SBT09320.1 Methyl-accepting chemotaxis sensory transducer with Cache sensor [Candidatus Accumulibacter aalborgensis]
MKLHPWTIKTRLIILSAVAMLGLTVLGLDSLNDLRNTMLQDRKDKIQVLVEVAGGVISHFHELARNGALSDDDARKYAAETLRQMRYSGGEYFFVLDTQHHFVMHPTKPELEGKNSAEMRDPNGKPLVQELVRTALASERGGTVDYVFAKPGSDKPVAKISYAAQFKPWGWVYGTGIYLDDVDRAFRSQAINALIIIALVLTLLAGVAVLIGRSVLRQLGGEPAEASAVALRIAAGDLSQEMHADQLAGGSLMQSMARMQSHLRQLISEIDRMAGTLASRASQISVATDEIGRAAEEQANSTSATAASIEELTVSINEVAQNAQATGKNSNATADCAEQGRALVNASTNEIEKILAIVARSSTQIGQLAGRSRDIGGIAGVIREIAEQTNLLALNAAIEAARAGEQGRGFAVVADEVRKLAERTSKATSEISAMVVSVQADTELAVEAMAEAGPQAALSLDKARAAGAMLETIHRQALESSERVHEVATATHEQAVVANDVARHVQNIASMTEEASATMRGNATSVVELNELAKELRATVANFRVV